MPSKDPDYGKKYYRANREKCLTVLNKKPGTMEAQRRRASEWRKNNPDLAREKTREKLNRITRENDESRNKAVNYYRPWTDEEDAIVSDSSRTMKEMAACCSRTILSIKGRRMILNKERKRNGLPILPKARDPRAIIFNKPNNPRT